MTNEELLAKIKAEIERRIDNIKPKVGQGFILREQITRQLKDLLSFLDTLEKSEKPMNQDGLGEEIQRFLSNATKMNKGKWKGKYPISEMGFSVVARHFTQWGAEHAREQMMKQAVEYEVWDYSSSLVAYPHVNIPLDNKQYRSGDKVRVIVLRKED